LLNLKAENHRENIHAQRLYKRRRFRTDGSVMSNWMTLNQTAIDDTTRPQGNITGNTYETYNINVYTDGDDSELNWEPIYGDSE